MYVKSAVQLLPDGAHGTLRLIVAAAFGAAVAGRAAG